MTITILTLFPGLFDGFLRSSILARAIARGLIAVKPVDIRDYASGRHRVCDDAAYGGGPGMVMKPEPIAAALEANGAEAVGGRAGAAAGGARGRRVVYLTPAGRLYTQGLAAELAREEELLLLCGRYEGVDQRVIDAFVTDEVSIGDYVLSGGEVPAMVVVDSIARLLPGCDHGRFAGGGELRLRASGISPLHAARGVPRDGCSGRALVRAPREDPPVAACEEHREDDEAPPGAPGFGKPSGGGAGAVRKDEKRRSQ